MASSESEAYKAIRAEILRACGLEPDANVAPGFVLDIVKTLRVQANCWKSVRDLVATLKEIQR